MSIRPTRSVSRNLLLFALIFGLTGSVLAQTSPIAPELNSNYSVSAILDQDAPAFVYFERLRILPSGKIQGLVKNGPEAAYYISGGRTTIVAERADKIRGSVTKSRTDKNGVTRATVTGRNGFGLTFEFRLNSFRNRPAIFRGTGRVEYAGRTYRVRISNNTEFPVGPF